jgi:hypothetical protein
LVVGWSFRLYGPGRFIAQLEHKLAAYTWNLVENYETDFLITAHELEADGRTRRAQFRSRGRFEREILPQREAPDGVLLDSSSFRVRTYLSSTMESPHWHSPSRKARTSTSGRIGSMSWD